MRATDVGELLPRAAAWGGPRSHYLQCCRDL